MRKFTATKNFWHGALLLATFLFGGSVEWYMSMPRHPLTAELQRQKITLYLP